MKKTMVAIAAAAVALTGCGYQSAESGEIGVVQNGAFFPGADKNLIDCIMPETTQNQLWDEVFWYPARQISWDATGETGSERPAYVVTSNAEAPAEIAVPVTITADLTRDCEEIKAFHQSQGTKYSAWMVEQDGKRVTSPGWVELLNYAIGQPTEVVLARTAQQYPWQQIWNDDKVRAEFTERLEKDLPTEIRKRTGGDYFTNIQVTVTKPKPVDEGLLTAIADEQKQITAANSAREAADAKVATAKSETVLAQEKAKQQAAEIQGYPTVEDYLKAKMIDKGLNPYQPQLVPMPASGN